jgi:maltose O-acetyltransferase
VSEPRDLPAQDPNRSEYDKLAAGEWFRYRSEPDLAAMTRATQTACRDINAAYSKDPAAATTMLRDLAGSIGDDLDFRPPVYLDYGERLHIGDNVFINADFMVLGGGEVRIGSHVLIGPGARIYTPNHAEPVDVRRAGWERSLPVTIEDDVWLGGSVVICPGVTIGKGSIVGAGSVVTKDVPPGVMVGGNPARVIRAVAKE